MSVVDGRKAGTDVQELADPHLTSQVPDRPGEEGPGSASELDNVGINLGDLVTDLTVYRVVILTTQPVVPDPGRVRHGGVDQGGGRVVGHGVPSMCSPARDPLVPAG